MGGTGLVRAPSGVGDLWASIAESIAFESRGSRAPRTEKADFSFLPQPFGLLWRDMDVTDEAIWNKYRDELVRYGSILVGSDDAEDLLSTVVVRILARGTLAGLDDPRSYLYRSVLNEARSLMKQRNRRRYLPEADVVLPAGVDPEILHAVLALPSRQKAAVYLTYWRDLPVAEVAQLMGCSPGSVKRHLHTARKRLREVFDHE